MTLLPADIRIDESEFIKLMNCLRGMYDPWMLSHIFLTRELGGNASVKISKLAELAHEAFFTSCADKSRLDLNKPDFSMETFRHDALRAVTYLQWRLIALFKGGDNKNAYMLVVCDQDVHWSNKPKDMQDFINKQLPQR